MNYQNELYHYGIKGQKWGVRRFQNPDGSYTQEGKMRYSANPGKAYRDKYGELTEAGKKRNDERAKRFEDLARDTEGKINYDKYIQLYDEEEKRVRSLFEKSSNQRMRDPATQQKILKTWNDTLFSEYDGDYKYLPDKQRERMIGELNKQEKKSSTSSQRSQSFTCKV